MRDKASPTSQTLSSIQKARPVIRSFEPERNRNESGWFITAAENINGVKYINRQLNSVYGTLGELSTKWPKGQLRAPLHSNQIDNEIKYKGKIKWIDWFDWLGSHHQFIKEITSHYIILYNQSINKLIIQSFNSNYIALLPIYLIFSNFFPFFKFIKS